MLEGEGVGEEIETLGTELGKSGGRGEGCVEQTIDRREVRIGVIGYESIGHIEHSEKALHSSVATSAVSENDKGLVEDDAEDGAVERVGYDELGIVEATQPLLDGCETGLFSYWAEEVGATTYVGVFAVVLSCHMFHEVAFVLALVEYVAEERLAMEGGVVRVEKLAVVVGRQEHRGVDNMLGVDAKMLLAKGDGRILTYAYGIELLCGIGA